MNQPINLQVGNARYLARPIDLPTLSLPVEADLGFVTHLQVPKGERLNTDVLRSWKSRVLENDDVFQDSFLQKIVFGGLDRDEIQINGEIVLLLEHWKTRQTFYIPDTELNSGPYYIHARKVYTLWKLYDDPNMAFVQSIWPSIEDDRKFVKVNAAADDFWGLAMVVPARSYSSLIESSSGTQSRGYVSDIGVNHDEAARLTTAIHPLRGLRVAVKDNYAIHGTKTTLCNRAFCEIGSIKDESATLVSKLIDAGAQIVGKAHMSAFAMMEHPMQSIDYQASFNPRGDGYLITGGSSGGSAAAIASYQWLDLAICTDTTGSARIPAFQTGVFGLRPSTFSISTEGVEKAWSAVDTPGFFSRDLSHFPAVLDVLQPGAKELHSSSKKSNTRILYFTDFAPHDSPEQIALFDKYLSDLSKASKCQYSKISLSEDWHASAPCEEKDLDTYLYNTTEHGWYYAAFHSFSAFRQAYKEKHGHEPFVTEVIRWYWSLGKQVSHEQHQEILQRFAVFREWFLHRYMANTDWRTLCAIHIDKAQPKYRDEYPGNGSPLKPGLKATFLAAILQAPELAIPVGQVSYKSCITGEEEQLPFVVGLMGAPNSDLNLVQWGLDTMRSAHYATVVNTGKTLW